jgi:hypothetical protein
MINIQTNNIVTAIEYGGDPRLRYQSSGISEELRAISNLLKEGLDGLGAWVQIYALMPSSSPTSFEHAARELNRMYDFFADAYMKLINYGQQLPPPRDLEIAIEIETVLDKLLRDALPKETMCELAGIGWTSWADRIDPRSKTTQWSLETAQQLLTQVTLPSWQKARSLLAETRSQLP